MLHASRSLYGVFAVLFTGTVAYAVLVGAEASGADELRLAIELVAIGLVAWRAATAPRLRTAWALMTVASSGWAAADLVCSGLLNGWGSAAAGPLYGVSYLFAYAMIVALLRDQAIRPWRAFLVLDGLTAGLTAAAVFMAILHAVDASALHGAAVRNVACDVLLITTATLGIGLRGWWSGRGWWLLTAGVLLQAGVDGALVVHPPADLSNPGWLAQSVWLALFVVYSLAAWMKPLPRGPSPEGWPAVAAPLACGALALALLIHAGIAGGGAWTVALAGGAIAVGWVRAVLLIAENLRLLKIARSDATTDKLTGLPNRRALIEDLDAASRTGTHTLAFFDLDGFKEYNDAFGHPAGDALLQRQAPRLAAVGRSYRLGGDEFCLLLDGALSEEAAPVRAAVDSLSEHGDGFAIGASFGLVVLPDDAADATEALRLADERMYARKRRRRAGQRGPARDVLVQLLAERNAHGRRVAQLAAAAGRRLGLDAEELDVLVRAAELHDVGNVAIPDAVLQKPGPLDAAEWPIVRQHTVAGERILAVAESMRPVARIVRASHERWDGAGYPDRLAAGEIPLAARIVHACDALDAMLSPRPYRDALTREQALRELRNGAGTQFDPLVVEVVAELAANLDTVVSG